MEYNENYPKIILKNLPYLFYCFTKQTLVFYRSVAYLSDISDGTGSFYFLDSQNKMQVSYNNNQSCSATSSLYKTYTQPNVNG